MHSRLRIAWMEEWESSLASLILPKLARLHDIHYVTAGDTVPKADFREVIHGRRWKYMNIAGFELSRRVNALYRDGLIDMAVVWASIGFGLRNVPFINCEGGSVYAHIRMLPNNGPLRHWSRRLTAFLHYALPEIVCNRRAVHIIVPSRSLKHDLMTLHGLQDSKVSVVPHGVDVGLLALYERKVSPYLPRILFIGRLHPAKGISAVVREFVRRKDIRAEFLVVGDGPEREELKHITARDVRVKLLGFLDRAQLESTLLTTNIFVFPTFYEGFGLALTEAMATGHACVTYDLPVTREILGESGVYIAPGDSTALVEELARLATNPARRDSLSAEAHRTAKKFSWDDAAIAFDQILRETVRRHATSRDLESGRGARA